jgi:hypothetical protein
LDKMAFNDDSPRDERRGTSDASPMLITILPSESFTQVSGASGNQHLSNQDILVTVSFKACGPRLNFIVPDREITLTQQIPSIRIGRASKVPSKGYVAAHDNTWFESPVMSRKHAELLADFDNKVGSIHPTRIYKLIPLHPYISSTMT